ncbi:MAG TPA: UDP-2,3-diacylglucosamine diphosphatase [Rubrivivax sp.]
MGAGPLPLPLPVFFELAAPGAWQAIDLISDLHLSESTPATFEAWTNHLRHTSADAVYMLGDLFEVWVGDDACERPFERRCIEVLSDASTRLQLGFMAGNRDFLVGAGLLAHCGLQGLADPTVLVAWGRRVLLTHGDVLCVEDREYQAFRREVRSEAWRSAFLARPLADRTALAAGMRNASEERKRGMPDPALWADVDAPAAVGWMHAAGTAEMVHGHTHRPASQVLAPGFKRHVLSDWDLDSNPPRAEVMRLTRDGFSRMAPAQGA